MGAEFNGIQRRDVYELPIASIRALIANAVVHRSYLEPAKVQVALYDDRLEITSPGRQFENLVSSHASEMKHRK